MTKKAGLWMLVFLLASSLAYAAPDRAGKVDVGVNFSGIIPHDDESDSALYVGGSAAYGVNDWFAVGIESGWTNMDQRDDSAVLGFSDLGSLTGVPLFGDFILRVPNHEQGISPYGVVGLGLIFWDYQESSQLENLGVSVDIETSFAAKFGGGVDWFLDDHWMLNLELAYIVSDADTMLRGPGGSATVTVDTDYWTVGGGLKYLF